MLDFLIYLFVMSISPGPNPILSMANAAAVGLRKGIRLNFGMLTGIAFVTAIDFIIAFFLYSYVPKAETAIRILTFIYLMYLAWKMFRKGDLSTDKKGATFREGMLLQLVNAKVYMMALTCLVSYIFPMTESLAEAIPDDGKPCRSSHAISSDSNHLLHHRTCLGCRRIASFLALQFPQKGSLYRSCIISRVLRHPPLLVENVLLC